MNIFGTLGDQAVNMENIPQGLVCSILPRLSGCAPVQLAACILEVPAVLLNMQGCCLAE